MTLEDWSPLSLDQVRALGEATMAFGLLEGTIVFAAALLVEPDIETGLLAGAGDGVRGQLSRFQRLTEYRLPKPLAEDARIWIRAIEGAILPERNIIVHGAWLPSRRKLATSTKWFAAVAASSHGTCSTSINSSAISATSRWWCAFGLDLLRRIDMAPKWAGILQSAGRDRARWDHPRPPNSSDQPRYVSKTGSPCLTTHSR